jgi:hypothetical protein
MQRDFYYAGKEKEFMKGFKGDDKLVHSVNFSLSAL